MEPSKISNSALACVVSSASLGGFSAAAKRLDLTPAAVSKNVAQVEAQLGLRLFNRSTRQLIPTDEGRVFVERARAALEALTHAFDVARDDQTPSGLVRMSCSVGFGRRHVLPLLPSFFLAHPHVQVELSLNDMNVDLIAEGFDLGIRGGTNPPQGMVARQICALQAILIATPQYLSLRGTPTQPSDLSDHDVLRVKFLSGRTSPWLFKADGRITAMEPQAKLLLSDPEMILDAALLHLGIARIGRHHAHAALVSGQVVEVLAKHHASDDSAMSLFYPHRQGLAPRVRCLIDHLMNGLQSSAALQGTHAARARQSRMKRNPSTRQSI